MTVRYARGTGDDDPLRRLVNTPVARADRVLFAELNPGRDYSPILSKAPQAFRPAAVLIPILMDGPTPRVIFTQRTSHMPSHAGEISFPGGGPRKEDPHLVATALREAEEEIGLSPRAVEVVGTFGRHRGGLGYEVTPVIGRISEPVQLTRCEREVDEIFTVPMAFLTDPANHIVEDRVFKGISYRMFAIPYRDGSVTRHIWGLTAGILDTLARAWHGRPLER
jgi:8-oxo-dGTP pyrophosphatase MutT (NUDIX family)